MKKAKKKAARTQEAKQQKRLEILRAALDLFVRKGFFSGSMNELARELGVAKGTLYVYFPSKEALWLAIVEMMAEDIARAFEPILASSTPPMVKLEGLARATFEYYDQHSDVCSIMIKIWASADSSLETDMRAYTREMYDRYRRRLAAILEEGVAKGEFRAGIDTEAAASFVLALLDGLIVQWMTEPAWFGVESCVRAFRDVCLQGLAASGADAIRDGRQNREGGVSS
jgi:AcrR family transcriptional regulator